MVIGLLVGFMLTGCNGRGASAHVTPYSAIGPSPDPVTRLPLDSPEVAVCPGSAADRQAVIRLETGRAFWTVFPSARQAPELEVAEGPVSLAIYESGYRGPQSFVNPGHRPVTPESGKLKVCAVVDGYPILYGSVSGDGLLVPAN